MSPNKNYISGRNWEYRVKKAWEDLGYTVIRSAGSKGRWDLVAVPTTDASVRVCAIQCKRAQTVAEAERLIGRFKANAIKTTPVIQVIEVYVVNGRQHLKGWI